MVYTVPPRIGRAEGSLHAEGCYGVNMCDERLHVNMLNPFSRVEGDARHNMGGTTWTMQVMSLKALPFRPVNSAFLAGVDQGGCCGSTQNNTRIQKVRFRVFC